MSNEIANTTYRLLSGIRNHSNMVFHLLCALEYGFQQYRRLLLDICSHIQRKMVARKLVPTPLCSQY
jgi:hypothetical protein